MRPDQVEQATRDPLPGDDHRPDPDGNALPLVNVEGGCYELVGR